MRKAAFLRSWLAKAILFVFLGTICLDSGLCGWIVGAYMIALGALIVFLHMRYPYMLEDEESPLHAPVTGSTTPTKETKADKKKKGKETKNPSDTAGTAEIQVTVDDEDGRNFQYK